MRGTRDYVVLCGVIGATAALLLIYSQTFAFAWDEGFHLLAAQLIRQGKRPYLDFCFPQAPLNAYGNAFWIRLFGDSWRPPHVVAALLSSGAVLLTADYVFTRFPARQWRLALAIAAALLVGLNAMVVEFGTVGQAYGLCLLLIVAAFRVAILAPERANPAFAAAAGLLANAAAASSLLTALVPAVLLIWIVVYAKGANRWGKAAAFLAGSLPPWLPALRLFAQSARRVVFGIVDYNRLYRQVEWEGAIAHDLRVVTSWLESSQAFLTGLLAAAGLLFVMYRSGWDRRRRAEYYLCFWLAIAVAAIVCSAHPTFPRYFLLTTPFLAIPGAVGLYAIASRAPAPERPFWPVLALGVLLACGLAKSFFEERYGFLSWPDIERVARKTAEVAPAEGPLLADENIYFLSGRQPPTGMELADSHRFDFPPAFSAEMHLVPQEELERRIQAGFFNAIETCQDDADYQELGIHRLYAHRVEIAGCAIYWDLKPASTRGGGF